MYQGHDLALSLPESPWTSQLWTSFQGHSYRIWRDTPGHIWELRRQVILLIGDTMNVEVYIWCGNEYAKEITHHLQTCMYLHLTNRFRLAVHVYSDKAHWQMTSKRGKNKDAHYEMQTRSTTAVLNVFWWPLCTTMVFIHCFAVIAHKIRNIFKIFVEMICVSRTLHLITSFMHLYLTLWPPTGISIKFLLIISVYIQHIQVMRI